MKFRKILPTVLSVAVAAMILLPVSVSAVETKTEDKITTLNLLPSSEDDLEEFFIPSLDEANEYEYKDGVFTITRTADLYSAVSLSFEQAGYEMIFDLTKDLTFEYDFEIVSGLANLQIVTPTDMDIKFAVSDESTRPSVRLGNLDPKKGDVPAGKYSGSFKLNEHMDEIDPEGELFIREISFYTIGKDTVVKFNKLQIKGTSLGDKIGEASTTPTQAPTEAPTETGDAATPTIAPTTAAPTTAAATTAKASTPTKAPTGGTDNADNGGIQTWVIVVIVVAVVAIAGGLVYYFLVVKKKKK